MARTGRSRRSFGRKSGKRKYKNLFLIVCEGAVTERAYFNWLNSLYDASLIKVEVVKKHSTHSSPQHLIKAAISSGRRAFQKGDELWIVLDKDEWTENQFLILQQWSLAHQRNRLAVSSPCFEYWILLHYFDPKSCSRSECIERYAGYMGGKTKEFYPGRIWPKMFRKNFLTKKSPGEKAPAG